MNRVLPIIIVSMLMLIFMCSCNSDNIEKTSNVHNNQNEQAENFNENDNINDEANMNNESDYSLAYKVAEIYEKISEGGSICEYTTANFVMELTDYLGIKDDFVNMTDELETFSMNSEDIREILSYFFVNQYSADDYSELHYPYTKNIVLEPFKVEKNENGDIVILYGRFAIDKMNVKHWLYPVKYTMIPYEINEDEVPTALCDMLKDKETGYKVLYIENICDIDIAKQIYSENGYGNLFEEKSYEIRTVEDFLAISDRVNSGIYNEMNANYILMCDLDLTGVEYTPIGLYDEYFIYNFDLRNPVNYGFSGNFDGNNHTISNLRYVPKVYYNSYKYNGNEIGIFARISQGAVVKNLNIEDAYIDFFIDDTIEAKDRDCISVNAGILAANSNAELIENCNVSGFVRGVNCVGGMVGMSGQSEDPIVIKNCNADVDVYGEMWVGGFIGDMSQALISQCTAKGTVSGDKISPFTIDMPMGIGGFAGSQAGMNGRVENCGASVWVKTMVNCRCVGSFIGMNDNVILNCIYNNTVGNWNPVGESYEYEREINEIYGYPREEYYKLLPEILGGKRIEDIILEDD